MKIWRKSRLSECHANLFANGRVRAIYVNISVMCAALLSLASCKPSARQTAADAEQPTDSTEAVTSADTLRLVPCHDDVLRTEARQKIDRYIADHPPVETFPRFYLVLLRQPIAPMEPDGMSRVYQM